VRLLHGQAEHKPSSPQYRRSAGSPWPSVRFAVEAFQSGLADLGYMEGKNIRVLYRFADGNADRLSALTGELVSLGATVIVTTSTTAIRAAHGMAPNVPIVSWSAADPVLMGWAQTLARPGGMITGVFLSGAAIAKRFELFKEVRPQATTFGLLMNAANPGNPLFRKGADDAAQKLGINLAVVEVKDQSELADAIHRMASLGVAGLAITPDPVLGSNAAIAKLALKHKLPSVGDGRSSVDAGGLFAFAEDYFAMARRSAWYVDQILKGTAPGDLPAEQSVVFRLFVNLSTAKELGITIPPSVLARADEVID
jgi:putative tryptophan/tyrosine transport system substrate-binding protein